METGRIHSTESFGTVDGPGIRFVVFMQGCPMRCRYCHNPDTWGAGGEARSSEELVKEALRYRSYFGKNGGVTVSGGEPLLQLDFLLDLFARLKREGVHTCLDTSGSCFDESDKRYEKLLALADLVLLDIKHIDEEAHRALTGQSGAAPRAFARYLSAHGKPVWIRHVLVSGLTDDDGALRRLKEFIGELRTVEKIEVLPYHAMGETKYEKLGLPYPLKGLSPPSAERVRNAEGILKGNG